MIAPFSENYPFIDPPDVVKGAVSDLYIGLDYYNSDTAMPLYLTTLALINDSLHIVVVNNSDSVILDCTLALTTCNITGVTQYIGRQGSCYVSVLLNAGFSNITNAHIAIDFRAIYTPPKHITSIRLENSNITSSNIVLQEGNNIALEEATDAGNVIRPESVLTIAATPGAGIGYNAATVVTTSNSPIRMINAKEVSKNNNIFVTPTDCYSLSLVGGALTLRNDCTPCCKCLNFTTVAEYLDLVSKDYFVLGKQATLVRDKIQELIDKWNTHTAGSCPRQALKTYYIPGPAPYGMLAVVFRNITQDRLDSLSIEVELTGDISVQRFFKGTSHRVDWACDVDMEPDTTFSADSNWSTAGGAYTWSFPRDANGRGGMPPGNEVYILYRTWVKCSEGSVTATATVAGTEETLLLMHTSPISGSAPMLNWIYDPTKASDGLLTVLKNKINRLALRNPKNNVGECIEDDEETCS